MKRLILFLFIATFTNLLNAQTTSPGFNQTWAAQMQAAIDNAVANGEVKGVSVAVTFPGQGTFIGVGGLSKEGVPITPDMQFGVGSHSKTFTAVLMLKLQELNLLSLNDPVSQWLPNHPYIDPSITIRHLLTHKSGIFDFETEIDPHENFFENMDTFVYGPDIFYTPQDVLAMIGPSHFPKGESYSYSNTNHLLAAMIIEAVTGKSFVENLHEYILDPLDLDSTFVAAYEAPNGNVACAWHLGDNLGNVPLNAPHSMYLGSGSIYSTAYEMVQWYDNLFSGNVISQASLQELSNFDGASYYGIGLQLRWWPAFPNDDLYIHGGWVPGYTSDVGFDIKKGSIHSILANDENNYSVLIPILTILYDSYPRLQNDAGIKKIISPTTQKCTTTIIPQVVLKNYGSANLSSVTIKYQTDAGVLNSFLWTGNLQPDQEVLVSLPSISVPAGSHSFRSFTENPNNSADHYAFNNEALSAFNINTSGIPVPFDEGFEGSFPPTGWIAENKTVNDWKKSSLLLLTGSGSAVKNNWYDNTGESYDLELPAINLSSIPNPVLSFNYAYRFYGHGHADGLSILVSTNCGQSYHSVFNKSGQSLKTTTRGYIEGGYENGFYPGDNEWGQRTINLSAFKNNNNVLIKFRATNANGDNLYLDNVKVANVTDVCSSPTDLNELQITSSSVKLSWKFQGNTNQFNIYYRPRGTSVWSHKTVAGNKQWVSVNNLQSGTDYEWYVMTNCNSGNSLPSAQSFFTTEGPTASNAITGVTNESIDESPDTNLKVIPNPVHSTAHISFSVSTPGKFTLQLYDMNGRLVNRIADKQFNEGIHQITFDTKELKAGIYLLRLQSNKSVETKKIVVMK